LGAKLPAFLERHPEFTDVARLEWAYVEAFDGKQLIPLAAEDVDAVGPDTQLSLQPHLQLLSLSYPVDNLVLAIKRETATSDIVSGAASQRASHAHVRIPPMRREPVYLAVHRFEDSVYYRRLARETFLLLSALRSGASVGEAVSQALDKTRLETEEQAALLRESFAHASELGWLCSRPVEDEDPSIFVM
jgi:hypothetical protein